jgi:class 3 adenylate cyclase
MNQIAEKFNVLYVDDEANNLTAFKAGFRRDYNVYTALSGMEGLEIFKNENIHVVVTDQRMPNMTGVEFLQQLPEIPDNIRIILTGFSDIESIIEAINTGQVYRYITKPWNKEELKMNIDNAIETVLLRRDNKELIDQLREHNDQLEEKIKDRTKDIEKEKEKSDSLLRNILPDEIADELKKFGKSYARRHDEVTVVFADIVGFTQHAEKLEPELLINELDGLFRAFDNIVEKHGLEKIKTIGDAYMFAGGVPSSADDNAKKAVQAAIDIAHLVDGMKQTKKLQGLPEFDVRIGIHTGPVVSGVVGSKKFSYDIWGDTVNTAARLESCGEKGRVNISQDTHAKVKDHFKCTSRGVIEAKHKGEIEMYFVEE